MTTATVNKTTPTANKAEVTKTPAKAVVTKTAPAPKVLTKVGFLLSEVTEANVIELLKAAKVPVTEGVKAADALETVKSRFADGTMVSTKKEPVAKKEKWSCDTLSIVRKGKTVTKAAPGSKQEALIPFVKEQLALLYPAGYKLEDLDVVEDSKKLRKIVQDHMGYKPSLASNYTRLTIERIKEGH